MYGQSPYGSPMSRGMFMDPQMLRMLQMRDQMRAQYAPQPTDMPQQQVTEGGNATDMQLGLPSLQSPVDRRAQLNNQMQIPQQQTTEQTLEELQGNVLQMQQQQQRLSEHLGAGSGMLKQLQQPQRGLGGLIRQLGSQEPARRYTQGPDSISMRLQAFPVAQGNPFGG
jgi:hypothetical protein